ncbi:DUF3048 domain-containing protein [Microbacterium fluvii]|uniref:DUF3048 domain-containing protein n=1 Tax=Microbacterium fluvii TaxID=415215 RepID=A0ABW2H9Y0_9MICO|nr:DUF3048 domain-containing protein [Microbacterium fluvii]MCU4671773.1 DUF3048 domain-containing protein [Microbacterium fluvii]
MTPRSIDRRSMLAGLTVGAAAVLAGCAPTARIAATPTPTPTPTATPSATPTPTPTPSVATGAAPLRGTQKPLTALAHPSIAVKIDNHWDARPQWGLEHTDLVFEELVEGGLTRYVAVWHSDIPDAVGPVRSIRPMDPDIISPLGGIVAYSGGRAAFVAMMQNTPVLNRIHGISDEGLMVRSTAKYAPHNVVLNASEMVASHDDLEQPQPQLAYALRASTASAAAYGTPADGVDLVFSYASSRGWRWSEKSAAYLRTQDGVKDLDGNGERLRATNVVVLEVVIDWSYGDVPRTVLIDSGNAWVCTGGKVLQGTWSKKSKTAPIRLRNASGVDIHLAPGNTWIELVPTSGSVKVVG